MIGFAYFAFALLNTFDKKNSKMRSKFFKVLIIGLLLAFTGKTYAGTGPADYNKTIRDFIDSHMNSNYKKLDAVMGEDATFKIPRGEVVLIQSKAKLVAQMQQIANVTQNCDAKYEVLAKSDALVIARVDFNYENTIQHNFLILEKNIDKEWKITQVCKVFDDKEVTEPQKVIARN
ncbi:hypothetical protein SAMN05216524_10176 [Mucilaginibacter sp. OK098]|nr:hypothetical protein SAMN05216524_10176 [Mucilaginibacter sp. OK098]